jgi:diguanylate cyclase (GGDEF)-like protein
MGEARALGVLSPFVGGTYYGSLVAGVAAGAEFHGRRLIAVQTLDAAAHLAVTGGDPAFDTPISWDHVNGFVALADSVHPDYLTRLTRAGKPVVLVGHTLEGLDAPAVLPDNSTGIRAVVTHLIRDHGCRRIAFTGFLAVTDVRERYDAYLEVLAEHGLEPDVLLPATTNIEDGIGWDTTDLLRRARPDALVAATDRNAIGAIRVLAAGGLRCPEDILVTGFDDIDEVSLLYAELASVNQPLDAMGRRAVDLLIRQLDGVAVPPGPHLLPTRFVPRRSCGCTGYAERLPELPMDHGVQRLGVRLANVLPSAEADAAALGIRAAGRTAATTAEALATAATGDSSQIGSAAVELEALLAASIDPDAVRVISRAVQEYAIAMPVTGAAEATLVGCGVQAIMLALGRARSRAQLADKVHLRSLISATYALNQALLHRRDTEPRDPSWLGLTPATAGSIALRGPDGALVRTTGWRRRPGPVIPAGPTTVAAFPPVELLDAAQPGETVFVVKAKVGDSDRGWLGIVDEVENRVEDGREMVNLCAALLTIALDVRDQEQQLMREAQSDRLTGLPNRSSFVSSLETAVARRRAEGRPSVVLFLDLDGFKQVNDSMGHHTGDRLLVSVADRLRQCLRDEDVVGRFGGDEFLVLLDDITAGPGLDGLVERISTAVCEPYHLGERVARVGVSIGTAECGPDTTVDHLLQEADQSMYRVKAARRGAGSHRIAVPAA